MGRSTHAGRPQKVSGRLTDPPARPGRPVSPDRGMTGRVKTPDRRPGRPRPARRPAARALDDRGAAPPPRHHVRRGTRPAPHRRRSQCHGDPAQPGHRRAELGGSGQHRRRAAPPRSRPTPIPHHPRHHGRELQMKRTSRQNDGALACHDMPHPSMRGWDIVGTWPTGQRRSRADCCGYLNSGADLGKRSGPAGLEESAVLSHGRGHRSQEGLPLGKEYRLPAEG